MSLVTIEKGEYKLNASLVANVINEWVIQEGEIYLLTGENGSGKSSFLKTVMIPEIDKACKSKCLYFHSEQDLALQYYIIKGFYRGIKNENIVIDTFGDALTLLNKKYLDLTSSNANPMIYVLDEVDQYVELSSFMQTAIERKSTIILTTHNENELPRNVSFKHVRFEKSGISSTNIEVQK